MFGKCVGRLIVTLLVIILAASPVAIAASSTAVDDLHIVTSAQVLPTGGSGHLQVFDHLGQEITHTHLLAFTVSDPKILSVKNETFTARHPGKATITAIYHSSHDYLIHQGQIEITVEAAPAAPRPTVADLILRISKPTLYPGETGRVDVLTHDGLRITDSHNCIVTSLDPATLFEKDNAYTGLARGEALLQAHYYDARDGKNHTGQAKVSIVPPAEGIATPQSAVFTLKTTSFLLDGQIKTASQAPFLQGEDTVYLPVRALAQALGLTLSYDPASKLTTLKDSTRNFCLTLGAGHAYFNLGDVRYPRMQHPPYLLKSNLMVDPQEIAAVFGYTTTFDAKAQTLTIAP